MLNPPETATTVAELARMSQEGLRKAIETMKSSSNMTLDPPVEAEFRAAVSGISSTSAAGGSQAELELEAQDDAVQAEEELVLEPNAQPEVPLVSKVDLQAKEKEFLQVLDTVAKLYPPAVQEIAQDGTSAKSCKNPAVREWAEVFGTFRPRKDRNI